MIHGYARVSTQDQHLDGQIDALTAAGCGMIWREKASGADNTRPMLAEMLAETQPGDVIIVCKLDRIARSTQDLLSIVGQLDKRGVAFRVLNVAIDTGTPTGRLMLTMLGAIAEFERGIMLERQAEGIARAKAEGRYKGRVPTAKRQAATVRGLLRAGKCPKEVAFECGIGIASVYRIRQEAGIKRQTGPAHGH